jgi:hypothetical protein
MESYRRDKPEVVGGNPYQCYFFTINLTWTDPESNPVLRGEKPPTNTSAMAQPLKRKINLKIQSVPRSKQSVPIIKPVS